MDWWEKIQELSSCLLRENTDGVRSRFSREHQAIDLWNPLPFQHEKAHEKSCQIVFLIRKNKSDETIPDANHGAGIFTYIYPKHGPVM